MLQNASASYLRTMKKIAVMVILRCGTKYLLLERAKAPNTGKFVPVGGKLEAHESPVGTAIRETLEETGWEVDPIAFVGAYQWKSPDTGRHYLRMAFEAAARHHHADRALDDGIERALWMAPDELLAARGRHRSPLVWRVVEDYLAGRRYPLAALNHLA